MRELDSVQGPEVGTEEFDWLFSGGQWGSQGRTKLGWGDRQCGFFQASHVASRDPRKYKHAREPPSESRS
jgi:hypothetical protein